MLRPVESKPKRRKTTIDLHDKRTVYAVSEAIARISHADVQAKDCRNQAKTVVSAYVLGQDEKTAAQRLLSWWCIDSGMQPLTIEQGYPNTASADTVSRVMASAMAGYATLGAIERYGASWVKDLHEVPAAQKP